jgi:hypothetical protein
LPEEGMNRNLKSRQNEGYGKQNITRKIRKKLKTDI